MNKQLFCIMDDTKKEINMTPEISHIFNEGINKIKNDYAYLFTNKEHPVTILENPNNSLFK